MNETKNILNEIQKKFEGFDIDRNVGNLLNKLMFNGLDAELDDDLDAQIYCEYPSKNKR